MTFPWGLPRATQPRSGDRLVDRFQGLPTGATLVLARAGR